MLTGNRRQVIVSIWVVVLALCFSAFSAHAQFFILWGDEGMTECDVFPLGTAIPFDVYVFLTPGDDGAFAAEYKLVGLPGHLVVDNEPAPFVSVTMGTPFGAPGISMGFLKCQTETVWVWKVVCMALDLYPGYYMMAPHDDTQFIGVAICPGDRPMVDGYGSEFGYNILGWCRVATEESSWGAVKSMYK